MLVLGIAVPLGFAAVTYLDARNSGLEAWHVAGSALFFLLGTILVWYGITSSQAYVTDESGLTVVRGGRSIQRLEWHEIGTIAAMQRHRVLRIHSVEGRIIDVPFQIDDIEGLANEVARRTSRTIENG